MADQSQLTAETVRTLCGELPDRAILAVLETGADFEDLEIALAWLAGDDDEVRDARPRQGAARAVYDILVQEEAPADER